MALSFLHIQDGILRIKTGHSYGLENDTEGLREMAH